MDTNSNFYIAGLIYVGEMLVFGILLFLVIKTRIFE